jgi:ABC-type phosphate transport system substrate-binding protein
MKRTLFCIALVAALTGAAPAADLALIANASVTAADISSADIKQIFLGSKSSFGGSSVEPVLAESGAAHEEFLKTYLGKSDPALRNHFKSLVFTGKGSMPKSLGSDAAIVAYVAKTKGAIGYVSAAAAGSAKRLTIK